MEDGHNEIHSGGISFESGNQIEIYFPDEKIDYRFVVSNKKVNGCMGDLIVILPLEFKESFYKGEDFIQCKYVEDNILYTFGGEIIKIVHEEHESYIVIKKPAQFHKEAQRGKKRVSTKILCEYAVRNVLPGEILTRNCGFATIKDASLGGVSFLTSDVIPQGSILLLKLLREDIQMDVQIMTLQMVNEKMFYGAKILDFHQDSQQRYSFMLDDLMTYSEESDIFSDYR